MGGVTSQVPYVASEQISALLDSTHPTAAQNQKYLNKSISTFKTMTKTPSLVFKNWQTFTKKQFKHF